MLGSDARPKDSKEPGANKIGQPSRADSILLMRVGGGANATLSIPRDTVVEIPGHGQNKINAAYALGGPALAIRTVEQYLGLQVNHLVEVNFENFPQLIDALGGITYRGGCVVSRINGGFKNGGYTLRLKGGEQEIDGKQALALARTRKNECNPRENDLTRARRQQKIMGSIKDKVTSFETFVRLPWVAWAAPKAIRSDMSGPSLLGLVGAELTAGTAKPTVLQARPAGHAARRRPGPDGRRRDQTARGRPLPARMMRGTRSAPSRRCRARARVRAVVSRLRRRLGAGVGRGARRRRAAPLRSGVRADPASAGEPGRRCRCRCSAMAARVALGWLTFRRRSARWSRAPGRSGRRSAAWRAARSRRCSSPRAATSGREAAFGSVDLPFLALVVWAVVAGRAARSGQRAAARTAHPGGAAATRRRGACRRRPWRGRRSRRRGAPLGRLAILASRRRCVWLLSDLAITATRCTRCTARANSPRRSSARAAPAPRSRRSTTGCAT